MANSFLPHSVALELGGLCKSWAPSAQGKTSRDAISSISQIGVEQGCSFPSLGSPLSLRLRLSCFGAGMCCSSSHAHLSQSHLNVLASAFLLGCLIHLTCPMQLFGCRSLVSFSMSGGSFPVLGLRPLLASLPAPCFCIVVFACLSKTFAQHLQLRSHRIHCLDDALVASRGPVS